MASKTLSFIFFSILSLLQLHFSAGQTAVNAGYWFPESGIAASDIDSTLFTHLFCAFANLDSQTYQVTISPSNIASFSQFTKTVQLKNPAIETLLSIGGRSANSSAFATMASNAVYRKNFINSSITLARNYGFSGLDLDWEYPQAAADMVNMGKLLREWQMAVADEAMSSGNARLNLTAAVSVAPTVNGLNYPNQSISRNLDWINLMAYDFYTPARVNLTHAHAALYDPSGQVSGSQGVAAWMQAGIPAQKLVLGMPFYGYAWKLVNASNHGLLAPANGPVGSGDGSMRYNQIKNFINQTNAQIVHNATIVSDYFNSGTTWIGYDDNETISTKATYAKQNGMLGYFAWHVGADSNWILSQQAKQAWEASNSA